MASSAPKAPAPVPCRRGCGNPATLRPPALFMCRACYDLMTALSKRVHQGKAMSERPKIGRTYDGMPKKPGGYTPLEGGT